jgi:hypothetical protein
VVDREELQIERNQAEGVTLADLDGLRLDPVFGELGAEEAQGEPGADDGDVGTFTEQVRDSADVVLVAVGEHDRHHIRQPVPDHAPVGKDHIHTRLVLLGEQHPAVDDEQLPLVLEHGHVPPDLPESTQGDDAQRVRRGWRKWSGFTSRSDGHAHTLRASGRSTVDHPERAAITGANAAPSRREPTAV